MDSAYAIAPMDEVMKKIEGSGGGIRYGGEGRWLHISFRSDNLDLVLRNESIRRIAILGRLLDFMIWPIELVVAGYTTGTYSRTDWISKLDLDNKSTTTALDNCLKSPESERFTCS